MDQNVNIEKVYTVNITVTTKNQKTFSKAYDFKFMEYGDNPLNNMIFTPIVRFNKHTPQKYNLVGDTKIHTADDGIVSFVVTTENIMQGGYLYIRRASSIDNFKK